MEENKTILHLSKTEVVRREIETAIAMFFTGGEPVAIHLIAQSANDILTKLGGKSFYSDISSYIKPEHQKWFTDIIRKPNNFFKHVLRDENEVLTFNPEATTFILWDCVEMYKKSTGEVTGKMTAYLLYFWANNPQIIVEKEHRDEFQKAMANGPISKAEFLKFADNMENSRITGRLMPTGI